MTATQTVPLSQTISERLAIVGRNARRYRRLHLTLILVTLISGALATLLAADAALGTRVVAPNIAAASTGELPGDLPSGWKVVCGIIAIFTFAGTVSQGIHTLLKVAEHQAKSLECAGKLDALAIQSSQAEPAQNENLKAELAKLLRDYPEYVREV